MEFKLIVTFPSRTIPVKCSKTWDSKTDCFLHEFHDLKLEDSNVQRPRVCAGVVERT